MSESHFFQEKMENTKRSIDTEPDVLRFSWLTQSKDLYIWKNREGFYLSQSCKSKSSFRKDISYFSLYSAKWAKISKKCVFTLNLSRFHWQCLNSRKNAFTLRIVFLCIGLLPCSFFFIFYFLFNLNSKRPINSRLLLHWWPSIPLSSLMGTTIKKLLRRLNFQKRAKRTYWGFAHGFWHISIFLRSSINGIFMELTKERAVFPLPIARNNVHEETLLVLQNIAAFFFKKS